jgi:hypothetical protein
MPVSGLLERFVSPFREFGWAAGSLYLVDRVLGRLSPSLGLLFYEFMVQPIRRAPLLPANLSKNLEVRPILEGSLDVEQMEARPEIKAARFRHGARCLGVYRKGDLMGYLWYAQDRYREDEVRCDYLLSEPATSVFDFDLVVQPKYRMGLGFVGVWHGANELLSAQGVHHTFSRMTRFNLASRRAHLRLGARRIGRAIFLRAWGIEMMLGTLSPYVGLTMRPGQRVQLRMRPIPEAIPSLTSMP